MALEHLTSSNFNEKIKAPGVVVVDFFATWCGPCKMQSPILDQFAQAHDGEVSVCKVDVDAEPQLAARYGIMSIPTLLYFQDGKLVNKTVGLQTLPQINAAMGV